MKLIDLTRTATARTPLLQSLLPMALNHLGANAELADALRLHRFHGTECERSIAATWVGRRLGEVSPGRLLLAGGTQVTLQVLFATPARDKRTILRRSLAPHQPIPTTTRDGTASSRNFTRFRSLSRFSHAIDVDVEVYAGGSICGNRVKNQKAVFPFAGGYCLNDMVGRMDIQSLRLHKRCRARSQAYKPSPAHPKTKTDEN